MSSENEYCAQLKAKTRVLYQRRPRVFCPYFKEDVAFTANGFHHLQYDSTRVERSKKAQIRRYKVFPLAIKILSNAGTVQQHRRYASAGGKITEDWCFTALLASTPGKDIQVKVVVRKIGDGPYTFQSVMPFKAPDYLAYADPD